MSARGTNPAADSRRRVGPPTRSRRFTFACFCTGLICFILSSGLYVWMQFDAALVRCRTAPPTSLAGSATLECPPLGSGRARDALARVLPPHHLPIYAAHPASISTLQRGDGVRRVRRRLAPGDGGGRRTDALIRKSSRNSDCRVGSDTVLDQIRKRGSTLSSVTTVLKELRADFRQNPKYGNPIFSFL